MEKVKRKTFKQQVIHLDDHSYTECTFTECHMIYLGATEVSLVRCKLIDCTWGFDGPAARVIRFMSSLYAMGGNGPEVIERTFENIRAGKLPLDPKQT